MTRLLSSALLLAAIPALAQMPPDGPGGHAHGGMMGMHLQPTVTGAPYTAQITTASTMKLQDGTPVNRTGMRTVYRDGEGRTREEFTMAGASGQRTSIVIMDPVAGRITRLDPAQKIATVQNLPVPGATHAGMRPHHEMADPDHVGQNSVIDLGSRTIAGINATGKRTTRTIPVDGATGPQTITRETWYSPDLKMDLSNTETDPLRGSRTMTVTSLTRSEPDPALFQVPAGYTTQQGPARGYLPHTGLPMGHGPAVIPQPAVPSTQPPISN